MEFYDRKTALNLLSEAYLSERMELVLILGRRRLGKTFLVRKFMEGKRDVVYTYVLPSTDLYARVKVAEDISALGLSFVGYPSWEEILKKLFEESVKRRIVVIFDEFQRLATVNPDVPAILQALIDEYRDKSKLMLILVGSIVGLMEKLANYAGPLYGRVTKRIRVRPLSYFSAREFFPNCNEETLIELYSLLGGTPWYLRLASENFSQDTVKTLRKIVLEPGSPLYQEPETLITMELRPREETYFSIFEAMARGKTTRKEISDFVGLPSEAIGHHLRVLEKELGLISRIRPVGKKKVSTKLVRYEITDSFFEFWFKFVRPNMSLLEIGKINEVEEILRRKLSEIVSKGFEKIVRQIVSAYQGSELLGVKLPIFNSVGMWWDRKGNEIDIAADFKNGILVGEVKWRKSPVDVKEANELIRKGEVFFRNKNKIYLIASKSGFTRGCKAVIEDVNGILLDVKVISQLNPSLEEDPFS